MSWVLLELVLTTSYKNDRSNIELLIVDRLYEEYMKYRKQWLFHIHNIHVIWHFNYFSQLTLEDVSNDSKVSSVK